MSLILILLSLLSRKEATKPKGRSLLAFPVRDASFLVYIGPISSAGTSFPIFDDLVYTLKRDNARSSSVGVVGSMLTSFDSLNASSDTILVLLLEIIVNTDGSFVLLVKIPVILLDCFRGNIMNLLVHE
ncbi:hypothetical protein Tco_1556880 [Tanacetum coccineum]